MILFAFLKRLLVGVALREGGEALGEEPAPIESAVLRGTKLANQKQGGCMLRISVCVCAFLLLACFVLPMAAQQAPVLPPITGSGTTNHITKWLSASSVGNSGIFETAAGNVGIGTITPAAKLDVNGTEDVRDTLTLFPKGVHPTLSVHGTAFAVSSTGKVTFVAGQTFPGTGTVTSITAGAGLSGGTITTSGTIAIKTGGVTNAMLQNSSLSVNPGTGLSGGGAVSLGGSTTLNNTGVLSVTTGAGITNTGGQNPSLGIDTSVVPELALGNFFTAPQFVSGFVDAFVGDATALYAFNTSTVSTNPTLYVENDDVTDAGDLAFDVKGPNFGGECSIDVTGNLFCTGVIGAIVNGQGKKKVGLYTMQSSEDWVEDFGSGALTGGIATIQLEPRFAKTISSQTNYHVFLTPAGDCDGLYIANRTATSFEVRELRSGSSSVQFDYRIVAHRKGFESSRLPDVSRKVMTKPARPTVPSAVVVGK
jgi:hypothetical protein